MWKQLNARSLNQVIAHPLLLPPNGAGSNINYQSLLPYQPGLLLPFLSDILSVLAYLDINKLVHTNISLQTIKYWDGRFFLDDMASIYYNPGRDFQPSLMPILNQDLAYLPPEVITREQYDGYAMTWMLGITLYKWVTNNQPDDWIQNLTNPSPMLTRVKGYQDDTLFFFLDQMLTVDIPARMSVQQLLETGYLRAIPREVGTTVNWLYPYPLSQGLPGSYRQTASQKVAQRFGQGLTSASVVLILQLMDVLYDLNAEAQPDLATLIDHALFLVSGYSKGNNFVLTLNYPSMFHFGTLAITNTLFWQVVASNLSNWRKVSWTKFDYSQADYTVNNYDAMTGNVTIEDQINSEYNA